MNNAGGWARKFLRRVEWCGVGDGDFIDREDAEDACADAIRAVCKAKGEMDAGILDPSRDGTLVLYGTEPEDEYDAADIIRAHAADVPPPAG